LFTNKIVIFYLFTGFDTVLKLLWVLCHGLAAVKLIQHFLNTFPSCASIGMCRAMFSMLPFPLLVNAKKFFYHRREKKEIKKMDKRTAKRQIVVLEHCYGTWILF